jgi:hypothetical protein
MQKPRQEGILIPAPDRESLGGTVLSLNKTETHFPDIFHARGLPTTLNRLEFRTEFRRLIHLWKESGPNLRKMLAADQVLAARIDHGRTRLVPSETGRGRLFWTGPVGLDPLSAKDEALAEFVDFVVNPYCEMLGGPCDKCDEFYEKKTKRQKRYCSQRCRSAATALPAVQKQRKAEHQKKIFLAKKAIQDYAARKRIEDWKSWVSRKSHISKKWLTRAENNKEISAPGT